MEFRRLRNKGAPLEFRLQAASWAARASTTERRSPAVAGTPAVTLQPLSGDGDERHNSHAPQGNQSDDPAACAAPAGSRSDKKPRHAGSAALNAPRKRVHRQPGTIPVRQGPRARPSYRNLVVAATTIAPIISVARMRRIRNFPDKVRSESARQTPSMVQNAEAAKRALDLGESHRVIDEVRSSSRMLKSCRMMGCV